MSASPRPAGAPAAAARLVPLLAGGLEQPFARRPGGVVTRRRFIADAVELAERLPAGGTMLNLSFDRYGFAVGFAAALLRGQTGLLPPNRTPDTVARLRTGFPSVYALVEPGAEAHGLPAIVHRAGGDGEADADRRPLVAVDSIPALDGAFVAARVLTSGSTGEPVPHAKPWASLVRNGRVEADRLAAAMGRANLGGVTLVATVPPQHMYGFESSVLMAMHGGAVLDAGRPFYPADIVAALAAAPRPRMLVSTPFHLKACLDSKLPLPAVDLVLCATAPLSPQLATRAEAAFAAPLVEIYGCTEAGQVATRRTTDGPEWRTFDGLGLDGDGDATFVSGGHVPEPVRLADVLEVVDGERFRLLGRSNDLVNIAGKRSSLGHLDFHLNAIEGVVDGAFWLPPDRTADDAGVVRLMAFVVAPAIGREAIVGALRHRIDAAFLPRRVVHVDALPRASTGKLGAAALAAFAQGVLASGER